MKKRAILKRKIGYAATSIIIAGITSIIVLPTSAQSVSGVVPAAANAVAAKAELPMPKEAPDSSTMPPVPSTHRGTTMTDKKITSIILEEFLINLNSSIKNDRFLSEKFYSDENLKSFFSGHALKWVDNEFDHKFIDITSSPYLPNESETPSLCLGAGVASWRVSKNNNKEMRIARITANIEHNNPACKLFSVDLIEEIFGKPTKITDIFQKYQPPPHGRNVVFGPKTHRLGNADIEYDIGDYVTFRKISFEIRGDGVVVGFSISIGDK